MKALQIIDRCRQLATCTEIVGETTRLFLSPAMQRAHSLLRSWMEPAGLSVRCDAAGNLRGLYKGLTEGAPRLLMGSHLDTVPNAGAFDGVLGVVLALALVEELQGRKLPFEIEILGFSEEEGVRYGKPFLGSLAMLGRFDDAVLALRDPSGTTVAGALDAFGLDSADRQDALLGKTTFAFVEFHIEQGPVLESLGRPLGVVSAIAGQTRLDLTFSGRSNHAGTTPMILRQDALAAAARWISSVEEYARGQPGLVATVGRLCVLPNASNVISSQITASLDVRHEDDVIRRRAVVALIQAAQEQALARRIEIAISSETDQPAVLMHPGVTERMRAAAVRAGHSPVSMVSGAGHDAMVLASAIPATMLFVRSPGGISHHPDESVLTEDVEAAFATGREFLLHLPEYLLAATS